MSQPPPDLLPLAQAYLHELHVLRQLSPHTLTAYQHDLRQLQRLAHEDGSNLLSATNAQVRRWAARLHAKNQSPRSIARVLSAWRGWFDWLGQQSAEKKRLNKIHLLTNPVADVKAPKRSKPLPKALSVEQAIALVQQAQSEAAEKQDLDSIRDAALIELLYSSGLRLSEVLGIDVLISRDRKEASAGWLDWDAAEALSPMGARASVAANIDTLVAQVKAAARPGDQIVCMSNGGFGGVHQKLLDALKH